MTKKNGDVFPDTVYTDEDCINDMSFYTIEDNQDFLYDLLDGEDERIIVEYKKVGTKKIKRIITIE